MPHQVDGAFVRAMSGTGLSHVRTEFQLRPPEPINSSLLASSGADIVMQSSGSRYEDARCQGELDGFFDSC